MAYNGMTTEQFDILLNGLKATYPSKWFIPTEEAANIWYRTLKDLPYEALSLGVSKWIMTSPKEPTIADIRKAAWDFLPKEEQPINEQEACAILRKAVQASGWHSEEEFNKLPTTIQKAVGSPQNLEEWSQLDNESFETVQMSQFLRNFRVVSEREREEAMLSPAVQKRLKIAMTVAQGKKIEDKHRQPEEDWAKAEFNKTDSEEDLADTGMSEDTRKQYEELMKGWA